LATLLQNGMELSSSLATGITEQNVFTAFNAQLCLFLKGFCCPSNPLPVEIPRHLSEVIFDH
jgi:hypothetical protein